MNWLIIGFGILLVSGCITEKETIHKEVEVCNDAAVLEAEDFLQCRNWCEQNKVVAEEATMWGEVEIINFECAYEIDRGSCCMDSWIEYDHGGLTDQSKRSYWHEFGNRCIK